MSLEPEVPRSERTPPTLDQPPARRSSLPALHRRSQVQSKGPASLPAAGARGGGGLRGLLARVRGVPLRKLWQALRQRLYSEHRAVGLRRDLQRPFSTPEAKVPLTVRPLTEADERALRAAAAAAAPEDAYELACRVQMLEAGLRTCYAAVDDAQHLCYVQWLLLPEQNEAVRRFFHGSFPWLAPDEALLEGAYTFASRRGLRIMPCAMAQLALEAQRQGARQVVTFVSQGNESSLKGCARAGFEPYVERRATWRLLRHRYAFRPLAPSA